jgi:hypothetical protein
MSSRRWLNAKGKALGALNQHQLWLDVHDTQARDE